MSILARITASLSASVDRLVGEIENHDAVVDAGIRDNRRAYARARVRFARLQQEGERLTRRRDALREETATWRRRALACADEARGIECLRRARAAEHQAATLDQTLTRHRSVTERLAREIESVRRRIEDLQHRRTLLRSREATADAAGRIRASEAGSTLDLDETFERWEVRVVEAEVEGELEAPLGFEPSPTLDPLETELVAAEERAELARELAALWQGRSDADADADHDADPTPNPRAGQGPDPLQEQNHDR